MDGKLLVGRLSGKCFDLLDDEVFFPLVWSDYYKDHINKISEIIQYQIQYENVF